MRALIIACCIGLFSLHAAELIPHYQVDDYAIGSGDRDTINRALEAMTRIAGVKTLTFASRDYHILADRTQPHARQMGADGLNNLDIDGQGARLWVSGDMGMDDGFLIQCNDSSAVQIRDLHLGVRPVPFVQGTIIALDRDHGLVTVQLDSAFAEIAALRKSPSGQIFCRASLPGEPWMARRNTHSWVRVETAADGSIQLTSLGNRTYRFNAMELNWQPGDKIVIWSRSSQRGWGFANGSNLRLDNISIDSAMGFAFELRGMNGALLQSCAVEPVSGAMLSACADGFDVQQSRNVTLDSCRVVANGDDMISFLPFDHGAGEQALPAPHPTTNEQVTIRSCSLVGGNRNGVLLLGDRATVIGNTIFHPRQYGLKFTGNQTSISANTFEACGSFTAWPHISDELDTGIICSDEWTVSDILLEGNVVRDWEHMPALQLKSMHRVKIRNNIFSLNDAALIANPANPYLKGSNCPVIGITTGHFTYQGKTQVTHNENVTILNNVMASPSLWKTAEQAVFNGDPTMSPLMHGNTCGDSAIRDTKTPIITSSTTAAGVANKQFTYQIIATNAATSYSATGLPSRLTLNTMTGSISGILPNTPSSITITMYATNAAGPGRLSLLTIAK